MPGPTGATGATGPTGTATLGTATPNALGTGAAGTSTNASHEDHVHPTTGVALLASANTFTTSPQQVTIATAANVGAIIKGAASQSGDLQQWQNSSGTVLAKVTSAGTFQAVIIDGGTP